MKRDIDLLLQLLEFIVEKQQQSPGWILPPTIYSEFISKGYSEAVIDYHVKLLSEAGFLEASIEYTSAHEIIMGGVGYVSNNGHEYIVAIKKLRTDPSLLKKFKDGIPGFVKDLGLTLSQEIIKDWAIKGMGL